MSALGHKRTFALQKVMSALPPKADMCSALGHVCFVPIADSPKGQYRCRQWSCITANAMPEKSWTGDALIVLLGIVLPIILLLFLAWHYLL